MLAASVAGTKSNLEDSSTSSTAHGECVSAPGTPRAHWAKFSHALVWPFELGLRTPTLRSGHLSGPSRTRGGFFDFEVGDHDGAYKGRVHVIVPFVWQKNGDLIDHQQSYNVLVLRVLGLEEGVMLGVKHCDGWLEHSFGCGRARRAPGKHTLMV